MNGGLEIERKFLVKYPKNGTYPQITEWDIEQIYLVRSDPAVQRRVRRICSEGKVSYYYTEKRKLTGITREENEKEITSEEYENLLSEADDSLKPVIKTRHIIEYMEQRFEMDCYPFSDEYATIELELENEQQEIILPPFIEVIKEVTGDIRYFNGALVSAQKFPEEE